MAIKFRTALSINARGLYRERERKSGMTRKVAVLAAFAFVIAIGAWACGDGDDDPEVTVVAEDTKFNPSSITIQAGEEVTLELQNNDGVEHDFQVDGLDVDVMSGGSDMPEHGGDGRAGMLAVHAAGHESMSITFMANEPGTFEFYCTIPGHKDSGMVGTLIVESP